MSWEEEIRKKKFHQFSPEEKNLQILLKDLAKAEGEARESFTTLNKILMSPKYMVLLEEDEELVLALKNIRHSAEKLSSVRMKLRNSKPSEM